MINEELAKFAWEGIHMSDYKPGSATAEYHHMCSTVDEAADRALKRAPHREDEIEHLRAKYYTKAENYVNEGIRIDAMCPSVLITGPANFPTKKKQKQLSAYDSYMKKDWGFQRIIDKLNIIGTDREPIKSGDDDALDRLRKKLEKRTREQDAMKAANAWWRKHRTMEGFEPEDVRKAAEKNMQFELDTLYFRDEADKENYKNKIMRPFAPYQLSNNNAEINRLKKRLEKLEREKATVTDDRETSINGEFCRVVENTVAMRLQLFFDGKPTDETRSILKSNGFRWARSAGAWQLHLNDRSRWILKSIEDAPVAPVVTAESVEAPTEVSEAIPEACEPVEVTTTAIVPVAIEYRITDVDSETRRYEAVRGEEIVTWLEMSPYDDQMARDLLDVMVEKAA